MATPLICRKNSPLKKKSFRRSEILSNFRISLSGLLGLGKMVKKCCIVSNPSVIGILVYSEATSKVKRRELVVILWDEMAWRR